MGKDVKEKPALPLGELSRSAAARCMKNPAVRGR